MAIARVVIESNRRSLLSDLKSLWQYRELLYFLIWRDVKVRYKQTVIGGTWAIIQPLLTMVMLAVIFGNFAKIPSDGLPYPIFAYTALLPWSYFARALGGSGTSVVNEAHLFTKVYFPRLVMPLSAATTPVVDFGLSFLILLGLMVWYGIGWTWNILALPLLMVLAFTTSLSVGLWLAPLNVRYRDIGYAIPFLIQVWMYASPVVYPVSIVPERWRFLYSLNPMVGVIEGFRWAVLGKESPELTVMMVSVGVVVVLLAGGIVFFRKTERTFADVI